MTFFELFRDTAKAKALQGVRVTQPSHAEGSTDCAHLHCCRWPRRYCPNRIACVLADPVKPINLDKASVVDLAHRKHVR